MFSRIYRKKIVGRDGSVGIATRYVLEGLGMESHWGGARFSAPAQTFPGAHPASFPGVNRPGRTVNDPSPSSTEFKETVKLYLYPPTLAFMACCRADCGLYFALLSEQHCPDIGVVKLYWSVWGIPRW